MSIESLSADCFTLVLKHLEINVIQELAVTSKTLRCLCLASRVDHSIELPMSKIEFPEILIKIASTVRVSETIERTGTDWLPRVLNHFRRIEKVEIGTKDLSRTSVKLILSICEASETVKTIVIDNYDVMRWSIYGKAFKTISIRPRWVSIWNTLFFILVVNFLNGS